MARSTGGIGVGSAFESTTSVPLHANGYFPTEADLLAPQLRHPAWPLYVASTGYRGYIKEKAQCYKADGVTPITSDAEWGTRLSHYTSPAVGGGGLPSSGSTDYDNLYLSDGTNTVSIPLMVFKEALSLEEFYVDESTNELVAARFDGTVMRADLGSVSTFARTPEGGLVTKGTGANAPAPGAVAIGNYSNANGENSLALAGGNANGYNSLAVGEDTYANADYTTALGVGSVAGGYAATALGGGQANGQGSFAVGLGEVTDVGEFGVALGYGARCRQPGGQALNNFAEAINGSGYAIGVGHFFSDFLQDRFAVGGFRYMMWNQIGSSTTTYHLLKAQQVIGAQYMRWGEDEGANELLIQFGQGYTITLDVTLNSSTAFIPQHYRALLFINSGGYFHIIRVFNAQTGAYVAQSYLEGDVASVSNWATIPFFIGDQNDTTQVAVRLKTRGNAALADLPVAEKYSGLQISVKPSSQYTGALAVATASGHYVPCFVEL